MGNLELDLKTPRFCQNVDSPGTNYAIEGLCQRVKSTTGNATSSGFGFPERVSANLCYFYSKKNETLFLWRRQCILIIIFKFGKWTRFYISLSLSVHKIFSSIFNFLIHTSYLLQLIKSGRNTTSQFFHSKNGKLLVFG